MNYEEKYRKALDAAKMYYNENKDFGADFLPIIFPELRESEYERIRKEIIELVHFFYCSSSVYEHHVSEDDMIAWLEKQGEQKPTWSEEDEEMIDFMIKFIESLWWRKDLTKRKDDVLSWLESIKDMVQPKQEWSEENKKRVDSIISSIEYCSEQYPDRKEYAKDINWLKSLKSQNHWKPSEEQMEALNAINNVGELSYVGQGDLLVKLYQDLTKL